MKRLSFFIKRALKMVAYQKMPKSQPVRSWLFSKSVKNKDVKKIENDSTRRSPLGDQLLKGLLRQ
ncbi:hypothetical protein MHL86_19530 [Brevibacillus laterosporus]|nr:hypothetical protein [Brevibacillus laterosporus]